MHFYRSLDPILAFSFDFDDTLYDNYPIITRAEKKSLLFLKDYHPMLYNISQMNCDKFRFFLSQRDPNICHDVTHWRWKSLKYMLSCAGLSKYEACSGADFAMDIIMRWRSQINISMTVRNVLFELSSKWPLVAITNGNVDPVLCGLENYFTYIFRSGKDGKSKPYEDMYCLASKKLGVPCKNILHVGDNLEVDVKGAVISGMQACWTSEYLYNTPIVESFYLDSKKYFPHLRISSLLSLTNFL